MNKEAIKRNSFKMSDSNYGIVVSKYKETIEIPTESADGNAEWKVGVVFPNEIDIKPEKVLVSAYVYSNNNLTKSYYSSAIPVSLNSFQII